MGGCAEWSSETRTEEAAYQVLSAVDTLQSYQGARHPECYQESDRVTQAFVGRQPAPSSTIAYGIGRGVLHAYVTEILEVTEAKPWWKRLWQFTNLAVEGRDVRNNWIIGLRLTSASPPAYAPCRNDKPHRSGA